MASIYYNTELACFATDMYLNKEAIAAVSSNGKVPCNYLVNPNSHNVTSIESHTQLVDIADLLTITNRFTAARLAIALNRMQVDPQTNLATLSTTHPELFV